MMNTAFWGSRLLRRSLLALLAGTLFAISAEDAKAEILETGYAYTPPKEAKNKDERAIGNVVVHARVFDRTEGTASDPWGTGIKDFEKLFIRGNDPTNKRGPELDRTAKYLYLYQVVYATEREQEAKEAKQVALFNAGFAPVHQVSIRLLVPTTRITSWGHFEETAKMGVLGKGVSFELPHTEKEIKDTRLRTLIPVAADPLAPSEDKMFQNPDKFLHTEKVPQGVIKGMEIRNEVRPVANLEDRAKRAKEDPPALGWYRGHLPSEVTLVPMANFEGAKPPANRTSDAGRDGVPVGPPPMMGGPLAVPVLPGAPVVGAPPDDGRPSGCL